MLAVTALEYEVGRAWDTFLRRKALFAGQGHFGLIIAPGACSRFTALRPLLASILYLDAVALFDAAMETQMPQKEYADLRVLKRRLDVLETAGKLLDPAGCQRIRERRNEVAHEVIQVDPAELDAAVATLHAQLEAWKLVGPAPPYAFFAERSGARDSDRPQYSFAFDYLAGVKKDATTVLEYRWSEYVE